MEDIEGLTPKLMEKLRAARKYNNTLRADSAKVHKLLTRWSNRSGLSYDTLKAATLGDNNAILTVAANRKIGWIPKNKIIVNSVGKQPKLRYTASITPGRTSTFNFHTPVKDGQVCSETSGWCGHKVHFTTNNKWNYSTQKDRPWTTNVIFSHARLNNLLPEESEFDPTSMMAYQDNNEQYTQQ